MFCLNARRGTHSLVQEPVSEVLAITAEVEVMWVQAGRMAAPVQDHVRADRRTDEQGERKPMAVNRLGSLFDVVS